MKGFYYLKQKTFKTVGACSTTGKGTICKEELTPQHCPQGKYLRMRANTTTLVISKTFFSSKILGFYFLGPGSDSTQSQFRFYPCLV